MCEILVTKGNNYGHTFDKKAYEDARFSNPDGAGYMLLEKEGDGWKMLDMAVFPEKYSWRKRDDSYWSKKDDKGKAATPIIVNGHDDECVCNGCMEKVLQQQQELEEDLANLQDVEATEAWINDNFEPAEAQEMVENMRRGGYVQPEERKLLPAAQSSYLDDPIIPGEGSGGFKVKGFDDDEKPSSAYGFQPDTCPEKIHDIQGELTENQILISHFRFATHGENVEGNTHPISAGDYTVIHNGVFGYFTVPNGFSDTRYFVSNLRKQAKKRNIESKEAEKALIEKLLKKAGGYYSIFIYSWRTKQLYYYKDERASFHWDITGLLGSTKNTRFPVSTYIAKSMVIR